MNLKVTYIALGWLFSIGSAMAQGLIPTDQAIIDQLPTFSNEEAVTVTVEVEILGDDGKKHTITEERTMTSGVSNLPSRVDLSEYAPVPGNQAFNDCVAWATAYCSMTIQLAQARGHKRPSHPSQIFSPRFVYPHINGGADRGSTLVGVGSVSDFLVKYGCGSLVTTPYDRSEYGWANKPNAKGYGEGANFPALDYRTCNDVLTLKKSLAQGIPVVIAVHATPSFRNHTTNTIFRWDSQERGARDGHAMCIIGYDDQHQAFLIQNSWGTDWGAKGLVWVSYDQFENISEGPEGLGWCFTAIAIIADPSRVTQYRKTRSNGKNYFFLTDGSLEIIQGRQARHMLAQPNAFRSVEATNHHVYGLQLGGTLFGYQDKWFDIVNRPFPNGLGGVRIQMIAQADNYLYALTVGGEIYGRIPTAMRNDKTPAVWESTDFPTKLNAIDIRYRQGSIYVTTNTGNVYRRFAGAGKTMGSWKLVN